MQVLSQYFYKNINYIMLNKLKSTIAIVDSGIGGISVLKRLIKCYPNYNYIYYADNLNMPYGKRCKTKLKKRIVEIINLLNHSYLVDAVIIACNTASSVINSKDFPNVFTMPFEQDKTYLATPLTKKSLKDIKVIADSNLASQIEKHIFDRRALEKIIKNHITRLHLNELSSFVLGCTHYELCYDYFKKLCPNSKIIPNSDYLISKIKFTYPLKEYNPSILILQSKPSEEYLEKLNKLIRG